MIQELTLPESGVDVVFRHASCADGALCEWLASRRWPNAVIHELGARARLTRKQMRELEGKAALFLDVAPPKYQCQAIASICTWVGAVEHHATTRLEYERGNLEGVHLLLDERVCASMLLWKLLHDQEQVPAIVELVNIRDTWQVMTDCKRADSWSLCRALSKRTGPSLISLCNRVASGGINPAYGSDKWKKYERQCIDTLRDGFWTFVMLEGRSIPLFWIRGEPLHMASDIHHHLCKACAGHVTLLMTKGSVSGSDSNVHGCVRGPNALDIASSLDGGGHYLASGFRCQTSALSKLLFN